MGGTKVSKLVRSRCGLGYATKRLLRWPGRNMATSAFQTKSEIGFAAFSHKHTLLQPVGDNVHGQQANQTLETRVPSACRCYGHPTEWSRQPMKCSPRAALGRPSHTANPSLSGRLNDYCVLRENVCLVHRYYLKSRLSITHRSTNTTVDNGWMSA